MRAASWKCCAARSRAKSPTTTVSLRSLRGPAGDRALAREHLRDTVRSETGALRGTLIRATLAREEQDYAQAIPLYEQVIAADRHFITEVLPPLLECYRAADRLPELDTYLERLMAKDATLHRDLAYAAIIGALRGSVALERAVERFVLEHPVLANLVNAAELRTLPAAQRSAAIERIGGGFAHYRDGQCALSLRELRLQHAAIHLAVPELQALGNGASDPELPARNRARAVVTKLLEPSSLLCCPAAAP